MDFFKFEFPGFDRKPELKNMRRVILTPPFGGVILRVAGRFCDNGGV
jgi:hypothetical protein